MSLNLEGSLKFSRSVVGAIQRVRKQHGLSQEVLAKKAGISRSALTMIESGARNPTLFVCHALTSALDLKLSDLVEEAERTAHTKGRARKA